ncbi:heavy-metal-associated domain-containing protein [Gelidibacter maritimus]|uniref:Heavy-metal-associated domain-containing protein n=1 Tax=Gelidibacter maritimus TaxID=2761487 RepID=A0A7W2M7H9_9FLAO|nr:heavy-metal-associated domain-containing protein [Gelidibacter maritimus]MBA6154149.1 heavy-metal-associated domain-containing protein [Gelidibacter maritimus]
MTYINDNVIPGNHGKTFRTDVRSPEEKSQLKAAIMKIDGVTDVIFADAYPSELTVHTEKVVEVNDIQDIASDLDFHVIAKGPFFPLF